MNSRRSITLATLLSAALSFVGMAQAQTPILNITENSSTSLTATLNGVPLIVTPGPEPEVWNVAFTTISIDPGELAGWSEPGGVPNFLNLVVGDPGFGARVSSDVLEAPGSLPAGSINPDGTTVGLTHNGGFTVAVTFTDLGDSSSQVPDTATTFGLLGISLAVLGILAKARPLILRPFNG